MNEPRDERWERRDVDVVAVLLIALLLIVAGTLTVLATGGMLRFFSHRRDVSDIPPPKVAAERENFPQPRLQVSPQFDLEKLRETEDKELMSYGWIDREKNIVRVPVERAIELLTERGLPAATQRLTPLQLQQQHAQERSSDAAH